VPVTREPGANAAITGVRPAGAAFTTSADFLEVTLHNLADARATLPVAVTVDSQAAGGTSATVEPYVTVAAPVEARGLGAPGGHLVEVALPEDAYSGDDAFHAVVERRPLALSLWLSAAAGRYLRAALAAGGEGAFQLNERRTAAGAGGLDGFILAGAFPTSAEEAAAVWERIRADAFAVIFAGGSSAKDAAAFLAASNEEALVESVSGATVAENVTPTAAGAHPVTRFLGEQADQSLASITVRDCADIRPPEGAQGSETPLVIETPRGRRAFLLFARIGEGAVAVFAPAADRSGGDFVVSPLFLPLLFESISHVSREGSVARPAVCGRPLLVPADGAAAAAAVRGPSGEVEAQLVPAGDGFAWRLTPDTPGFYFVNESPVAVNVARSESETRPAGRSPVERAFRARMLDAGEISVEVEAALGGREISAALFAAAIVLLAAEMVFVFLSKRNA
jgi:hypothetical protein